MRGCDIETETNTQSRVYWNNLTVMSDEFSKLLQLVLHAVTYVLYMLHFHSQSNLKAYHERFNFPVF